MAAVRPPTPIGDGKCPQLVDREGLAGEVSVADMVGLGVVRGSNELTNLGAWRGSLPSAFVQVLILKDFKYRRINTCVSVASEGLRERVELLNGNWAGKGCFGGSCRTTGRTTIELAEG